MANKDEIVEKIGSYKNRLDRIKGLAQKARDARVGGEGKLKVLKENEQTVIGKITEAGLNPDNLKVYIIESQKALNAALSKLEGILPDENGNIPNNVLAENVVENANNITIPDVTVVIPEGTPTEGEILKEVSEINFDDVI